jgi:hypothetical protein
LQRHSQFELLGPISEQLFEGGVCRLPRTGLRRRRYRSWRLGLNGTHRRGTGPDALGRVLPARAGRLVGIVIHLSMMPSAAIAFDPPRGLGRGCGSHVRDAARDRGQPSSAHTSRLRFQRESACPAVGATRVGIAEGGGDTPVVSRAVAAAMSARHGEPLVRVLRGPETRGPPRAPR